MVLSKEELTKIMKREEKELDHASCTFQMLHGSDFHRKAVESKFSDRE